MARLRTLVRTRLVAGVDEAGRGCLAGPVVAAAVVFSPGSAPRGLIDSKQLSPARREQLAARIKQEALSFAVGVVEAPQIDRHNILRATYQAMRMAVLRLSPAPEIVAVDGYPIYDLPLPQIALIKGDARLPVISAASILAKVHRDRLMERLHEQFPEYGFARHKGYATAAHLQALRRLGPCPLHRRSFRPVALLDQLTIRSAPPGE